METVQLQEIVGGALQEKFNKSFERVIENLQDVNTSYKIKRGITITLTFTQDEDREDVNVNVNVTEKLAPQAAMKTQFFIGKNLETGELFAEEHGKYVKGQMKIDDYSHTEVINGNVVDTDTGEIIETNETVVDFRKAATN